MRLQFYELLKFKAVAYVTPEYYCYIIETERFVSKRWLEALDCRGQHRMVWWACPGLVDIKVKDDK